MGEGLLAFGAGAAEGASSAIDLFVASRLQKDQESRAEERQVRAEGRTAKQRQNEQDQRFEQQKELIELQGGAKGQSIEELTLATWSEIARGAPQLLPGMGDDVTGQLQFIRNWVRTSKGMTPIDAVPGPGANNPTTDDALFELVDRLATSMPPEQSADQLDAELSRLLNNGDITEVQARAARERYKTGAGVDFNQALALNEVTQRSVLNQQTALANSQAIMRSLESAKVQIAEATNQVNSGVIEPRAARDRMRAAINSIPGADFQQFDRPGTALFGEEPVGGFGGQGDIRFGGTTFQPPVAPDIKSINTMAEMLGGVIKEVSTREARSIKLIEGSLAEIDALREAAVREAGISGPIQPLAEAPAAQPAPAGGPVPAAAEKAPEGGGFFPEAAPGFFSQVGAGARRLGTELQNQPSLTETISADLEGREPRPRNFRDQPPAPAPGPPATPATPGAVPSLDARESGLPGATAGPPPAPPVQGRGSTVGAFVPADTTAVSKARGVDIVEALPVLEKAFGRALVRSAQANNVDPDLLWAIKLWESKDDLVSADGTSGEVGEWQVLPSTARGLGFTGTEAEMRDPVNNVELAAKLLRQLMDAPGIRGDLRRVLHGYNTGQDDGEAITDPSSSVYANGVLGIFAGIRQFRESEAESSFILGLNNKPQQTPFLKRLGRG